jgi:hypothetical protein
MSPKPSLSTQEFKTLVDANPPGDHEVVVHVDGPLRANGRQALGAWWFPGRAWALDKPAGQCFDTSPEVFRKMWENAGYTLKVLPGKFKFGEPE